MSAATSRSSAPSRCGPAGGESVYAIPELPKEQRAPEEHLRRVFGEWVVEVAHSANLVVLRTPPGSAHVVGSALDRAALPDILGTVAGDDTLLVVASERAGGRKVAQRLSDPRQPVRSIAMAKRVVLAYSGGLDTSVAVRWMIDNYGVDVIALAVDVGQDGGGIDAEHIKQKALAAGAVEAEVVDAKAEFAADYLVPALQANALYEGRYPLVSALSRPVHREAPRRRRPPPRRRRRRPRLHRQGQRPGPLRGVDPRPGARPRRARARCGSGG